jgi:hypothetical protein
MPFMFLYYVTTKGLYITTEPIPYITSGSDPGPGNQGHGPGCDGDAQA